MNLDPVADLYVQAASASLDARLVRDQQQHRSESRGVLMALEALVGMNEACLLVEAAVERTNRHYGANRLLYEFWTLDRPRRPQPGGGRHHHREASNTGGVVTAEHEWRKVGTTEYRTVGPADILRAKVVNADVDTIYLSDSPLSPRKYVVYLNGQDDPIQEYREAT